MIQIENVSKWYGAFQVLADCTTSVQRGEVVVVCGPSGSGKSTLIKCINGLEPYQKGRITVDGIDVGDPKTRLSKVRAGIGMVFQHFELYPHMNAIDNIALAQLHVLKRSKEEVYARSRELLSRGGLPDTLAPGRRRAESGDRRAAPPIHSSRDRAMPRGNRDFSTDSTSWVSAMR